jgi:putative PIN family toxin of toxin-antitoxin system
MRLVFDTNVFISAFVVPASQGEEALRLACRRLVRLVTSVAILTETARKLRERFSQSDGDVRAALKLVSRVAEIVKPATHLRVLADDPDNRIIECAVEGKADLVVTGDRHLLRLRRFEGVPIGRLVDFLRMFPPLES